MEARIKILELKIQLLETVMFKFFAPYVLSNVSDKEKMELENYLKNLLVTCENSTKRKEKENNENESNEN